MAVFCGWGAMGCMCIYSGVSVLVIVCWRRGKLYIIFFLIGGATGAFVAQIVRFFQPSPPLRGPPRPGRGIQARFRKRSTAKSLGLCPTRHSLALKLRKHSFSFTHSRCGICAKKQPPVWAVFLYGFQKASSPPVEGWRNAGVGFCCSDCSIFPTLPALRALPSGGGESAAFLRRPTKRTR